MKLQKTKRGFKYFKFKDFYGSECSIQESSLATEDALWIGVDNDFNGKECTRMHINKEMAKQIIELLNKFLENGDLH